MRTEGVSIQHAENGGGYDESTRTVYEYYGCFWHGHSCNTAYNAERWQKTLERENSLQLCFHHELRVDENGRVKRQVFPTATAR